MRKKRRRKLCKGSKEITRKEKHNQKKKAIPYINMKLATNQMKRTQGGEKVLNDYIDHTYESISGARGWASR